MRITNGITVVICLVGIFGVPVFAHCEERGLASYYTVASARKEGTSGDLTASGRPFVEADLTCARRSRAWGTRWRVTSLRTGRSIVATQTDYGPGKGPAARGVIIDLTPACFKALGIPLSDGLTPVTVEETE